MGNTSSKEISAIEFPEEVLAIEYIPEHKWYRFKYLYMNPPNEINDLLLDEEKLKIIRVPEVAKYLFPKVVQQTNEKWRRGQSFIPPLIIDREIKDSLEYNRGWIYPSKIDVIPHDIVEVEDYEDLYKDYNEIVQDMKLDPNVFHLFRPKKFEKYQELIGGFLPNKDLVQLTDTKSFDPKEYPFHLAHAIPKELAATVIKGGKLCIDERCSEDVYDESSGIYLGNETKFRGSQFPGIYMELFQHSKIKPYPEPLDLDSEFYTFRYLNVDNNAGQMYGEVGVIYSFEDIFSKYRVALKPNLLMGYGDNITLDEYVYNFGGECIVRTNTIPLSKIVAMYIKFTFTEIDFIYDKLGAKGYTLRDVIKLYTTFKRNGVVPWFIRKSALKSVLDGYSIASNRSKNLEKLPPIFAMTPGRGKRGMISIYNDPDQDVESDYEAFDPNENPEFKAL